MQIRKVDPDGLDEAVEWVEGQLSTALDTIAPNDDFRSFVLFLLDDDGGRIGGLLAYTTWDWLVIDTLVVNGVRREGWGRALVEEAENIGRSMGCTQAPIESYSAEAFFCRLGYEVVSRIPDYPPGRSFVRMNRNLVA